MKKIIDGKIYNTETAEKIGFYCNGESGFGRFEETLYKTKKGRYFTHGEGGPMTHYAKSCGQNSWTGSEDIFALSESEAREWAEKHLSSEEYLKFFSAEEA